MGLSKLFKRAAKYADTAANVKFNELADPHTQLEQAITEAQEQDRQLKVQAANVIANQKMSEMRLHAAMDSLEKAKRDAGSALTLADKYNKEGNAEKAATFNQAATVKANQLIALEKQVEEEKQVVLQNTEAANKAQEMVKTSAVTLQKKLDERHQLLSKLDQAKMQEQMNKAMSDLSSTVDQTVPTLDEVRNKIDERYAKALGATDVAEISNPDKHAELEIEQAQEDAAAQARLDEMRSQLGLGSGSEPIQITA